MYKVNVTPADSFNDSGCAPNYEHDEEHDEGDYPSLNGNDGISLDDINTNGFVGTLKNLPSASLLDQLVALSHQYKYLKNFLTDNPLPDKKNYTEKRLFYKDKRSWTRKALEFCKSNSIPLTKKPVHKPTKPDKVEAKAHNLKHFIVKEHIDGKHGPWLEILHKKHPHHKHTGDAKHDVIHSVQPSTLGPQDGYLRGKDGRIIVQDGLARK